MNSPIDLTGKIAVVTGANGGIGKAIVATLRDHGATVVATDRQIDTDAHSDVHRLDVSDVAALRSFASDVSANYGGLDIWINNAGSLSRSSLLELEEADWNKAQDVNLRSVVFGSQAAAQSMARTGGGAIINLSSYAGLKARPNCIDYASAKAGVHHATKCLAVELGPLGIRVNAIAPGYINTRMSGWMHDNPDLRSEYLAKTPLGRLGEPEEIAMGALYLASPMSSFMTGHTLVIDGGIIHG
ncbi:short-chain dehydrogenase [Brucella anthropi]|uniref:SDR family NAD(P)-dependent oxidoreductase n=1 Tax=Brucella anthropi TaxID=529 RepID=UPI003985DE49